MAPQCRSRAPNLSRTRCPLKLNEIDTAAAAHKGAKGKLNNDQLGDVVDASCYGAGDVQARAQLMLEQHVDRLAVR